MVTAIGVLGGQALTRYISAQLLHKIAAALIIVMGVLMWFNKL